MIRHLIFATASVFCLAGAIVRADAPTTMPTTMPTTAPTTAPAMITWETAKDHVGQLVTVTGPVVGNHDFGGAVVLNVGKDFPAASRFTVFITADNRSAMPDDLYKGKTISVTGTIKMYHNVPEIEADAAQIAIIAQAATMPATQP
jgi:hypothetical protein